MVKTENTKRILIGKSLEKSRLVKSEADGMITLRLMWGRYVMTMRWMKPDHKRVKWRPSVSDCSHNAGCLVA